ncbi:MAG TPA: hypothetical protein DHW82_07945 [Spirochaetia bacterium]|nr:hypothetical protein [Spirochaetia bacterium]
MMNQIILETRVVRNDRIKFTSGGFAYLSLTLVFETVEKKDNQWQTKKNFIKAILWGKKAQKLAEYLKPGTPIIVRGKLEQNNWESKDGEKRSGFSLNIEELHFEKQQKRKIG